MRRPGCGGRGSPRSHMRVCRPTIGAAYPHARAAAQLDVRVDPLHKYIYAGCYDGHGGSAAAKWLKANLYDGIKEQMMKVSSSWHVLEGAGRDVLVCVCARMHGGM